MEGKLRKPALQLSDIVRSRVRSITGWHIGRRTHLLDCAERLSPEGLAARRRPARARIERQWMLRDRTLSERSGTQSYSAQSRTTR